MSISKNMQTARSKNTSLGNNPTASALLPEVFFGFFYGTLATDRDWGQVPQSLCRATKQRLRQAHGKTEEEVAAQVYEVNGPGDQTNLLAKMADMGHGYSMEDRANAAVNLYKAKIQAAAENSQKAHIILTGWSRGAATTFLIAQKLKEQCPFDDYVLELHLIEPCAGPTRDFPWVVPSNVSQVTLLSARDEKRFIFPAPKKIEITHPKKTKVSHYELPGTHSTLVIGNDGSSYLDSAEMALNILWGALKRHVKKSDSSNKSISSNMLELKKSRYWNQSKKITLERVSFEKTLVKIVEKLENEQKNGRKFSDLVISKNDKDTSLVKVSLETLNKFSKFYNGNDIKKTRTSFFKNDGFELNSNRFFAWGDAEKLFQLVSPTIYRFLKSNCNINLNLYHQELKTEIGQLVENRCYDALLLLIRMSEHAHNEVLPNYIGTQKMDGENISVPMLHRRIEIEGLNLKTKEETKILNDNRENGCAVKTTLDNHKVIYAISSSTRNKHYSKIAKSNEGAEVRALCKDYVKFSLFNHKTWMRHHRDAVNHMLRQSGADDNALYGAVAAYCESNRLGNKSDSSLYDRWQFASACKEREPQTLIGQHRRH